MLKFTHLVLLTALSAAACGRTAEKPPAAPITKDRFVAVMTDLGLAAPGERDQVLQKHHITDAQLRAYVKAMAPYPATLSTAFDSIQTRMDRRRMQTP